MRGTPNAMSLVALDRDGNHCAMTTAEDRTYVYQSGDMGSAEELPRLLHHIEA
jgi:beta-aspartyl-peptidase (threonine type)